MGEKNNAYSTKGAIIKRPSILQNVGSNSVAVNKIENDNEIDINEHDRFNSTSVQRQISKSSEHSGDVDQVLD